MPMSLRDFEKIGILQLVTFLYGQKNYTANRSAINENVDASTETIYKVIKVLQKYGLIYEVAMGNEPQEKRIFLTQKGIVAAKKLSEINKITLEVQQEFEKQG
jgi:DNA-binding PadR family transcriptional regulator